MAEVLFLGMSQSAPYFSHTCNYSYRGKRVQDNLCKTRPPKKTTKAYHTVQKACNFHIQLIDQCRLMITDGDYR